MRHVWFLLAVAIVVGVATEIPSPLPNSTVIRASSLHATFQKLTPEENEERLGKCGQLNWPQDPSVEPRWQPLAHFPWVLEAFNEETELETYSVVVLSKWHVLADRNVIRRWNLFDLFGDNTPRFRASVAVPSHSTLLVFVDDVKNPKTVIFQMTQEIPIPAVCMPEQELKTGDEVYLQHRESPESSLSPHHVYQVHPNGWAVLESNSHDESLSHVLTKKENNRFVVIGNHEHYTTTTNGTYLLIRSVFGAAAVICELTGVCQSPPHMDLTRISEEENEKRLKSCGRLPNITNMSMYRLSSNSSSNFSLARQHPWYVIMDRSDGFSHSGLVVSQRHILVDWFFFNLVNWKSIFRIQDEDMNRTISTNLPVVQNGSKVLDYSVTAFRCNDEQCESPRNETLRATKILVLPGSYAVFEIERDMGIIPACLFNVHTDQVRVSKRGSEVVRFDRFSIDNDPGFDEILVGVHQLIHSVLHFAKSDNKEEKVIQWTREDDERLCKSTGICPRSMMPVPLTRQPSKLSDKENEARRNTCGFLPNVGRRNELFISARDSPWIVGVRTSPNSSAVSSGITLSKRHVLVTGRVYENPEDLTRLIGDYQKLQPQALSVLLPDYSFPDVKLDFEVLIKICKGGFCESEEEITMKPSILLVDNSFNPSIFILQFDEDLPNLPLCLEERKEVEVYDKVVTQHFGDTQTTVVDVSNGEIETGILPALTDTSRILVRFDGNRSILAGFSPRAPSSSSRFSSAFSITPQICALTGVCPPKTFPVQLQKITEEENQELLETCGLLKTRYPSHNSTRKLSIARDAPWLLKVSGPGPSPISGVVISKRHAIMTGRLFFDDFDDVFLLGDDWRRNPQAFMTNTRLPFPRTHLTFSVTMRVCNDEECNTEREEVRIPIKIFPIAGFLFYMLEFDSDLPVTPACLEDYPLNRTDLVYVQAFDHPETLLNKRNIVERDHTPFFRYSDSYIPTYSEIMMTEQNGTFRLAAFYFGKEAEDNSARQPLHRFIQTFPFREAICSEIGVCPWNNKFYYTMPPNYQK